MSMCRTEFTQGQKETEIQGEGEDFYSRVVAVTNRHLCQRPFLEQIERICKRRPKAIILREKDMEPASYESLYRQVLEICGNQGVPCIAHTYVEAALHLGSRAIHIPLRLLKDDPGICWQFEKVGVSIHAKEEAILAERLGASYLTAGHIFATDCKKGIAPRGLKFLEEVCEATRLPVYAIGGMQGDRSCVEEMITHGASGICVMSECMGW